MCRGGVRPPAGKHGPADRRGPGAAAQILQHCSREARALQSDFLPAVASPVLLQVSDSSLSLLTRPPGQPTPLSQQHTVRSPPSTCHLSDPSTVTSVYRFSLSGVPPPVCCQTRQPGSPALQSPTANPLISPSLLSAVPAGRRGGAGDLNWTLQQCGLRPSRQDGYQLVCLAPTQSCETLIRTVL